MTTLESFIFGLLQGLTEFLPISSSAHLKLAKIFFGIESSENQVIFDLVCHLGTLVAVLYFFRQEIVTLFTTERKKLSLLLIATLPLVPCYLLLKPLRDFASAPHFLGLCMIITGGILFVGNRLRIRQLSPPSLKQDIHHALWIGTMQTAALIPGISRSASTISCATALGWTAKDAVSFSFLLSIPTVIGGNCLELLKILISSEAPPTIAVNSCVIGFTTSMIVGFIMIRIAMAILQKGNLKPFAWYCIIIGTLTTVYMNFSRI